MTIFLLPSRIFPTGFFNSCALLGHSANGASVLGGAGVAGVRCCFWPLNNEKLFQIPFHKINEDIARFWVESLYFNKMVKTYLTIVFNDLSESLFAELNKNVAKVKEMHVFSHSSKTDGGNDGLEFLSTRNDRNEVTEDGFAR